MIKDKETLRFFEAKYITHKIVRLKLEDEVNKTLRHLRMRLVAYEKLAQIGDEMAMCPRKPTDADRRAAAFAEYGKAFTNALQNLKEGMGSKEADSEAEN